MRKHFLLLFLMAILPLAGWAANEITAAPEAVENLTYNPEGLYLVTAGEVAEGWTMQYAKSDDGTITGDDLADLTWNAAIPKGDDAGTYFVYYRAYKGGEDPVYGAAPVEVTIAKKDAIVYINANALATLANHQRYGFKSADFTAEYEPGKTVQKDFLAALRAGADPEEGFYGGDADLVQIIPNWGNDFTVREKAEEYRYEYYNAGEHTFTLSVNAMDNYNVSLYPSSGKWYVDKKPLTVSAQNTNVIYGEAFEVSDNLTFSGFVPGENEAIVFAGQEPQWDTTYKDATTGTPSSVAGGPYSWLPSGLTADNYNITYNNGNIIVVAKDITSGVDIDDFAAVTYSKEDKKPTTITGKYGDLNLVAADYALTYWGEATIDPTTKEITAVSDDTDNFTNAGTYYVKIEGQGNYSGTVYKSFTINKKDLAVSTATLEKVYDATDYYGEATTFTAGTTVLFEGLEEGDTYANSKTTTSANITLRLEKNGTAVTTAIAAGDYDIKFGDLSGVAFTNYKMKAFADGQLKIAQRVVKITANNKNKTYGTDDPYKDGVVATAADVTVEDGVANQGLLAGDAIATYPTLKRDGADEQGVFDLYLVDDNTLVIENAAHDNVTANYAPQFIKGTYTIGEGEIAFRANPVTKTFGEVTVAQANAMLTATIVGMPENLAATIQDKVNGLLYVDVTGLDLDDDDLLPAKAAGYSIKFKSFTADEVLTPAMLENYSSTITTFSEYAKFTVKKAPLKIEALTQSLVNGATIAPASAETVKIITENVDEADLAVLFDPTNGIHFVLETHVEKISDVTLDDDASAHGWDGEVAKTNGIYVGGIVINAATYNDLATANYTLDATVAAGAEAKAGLLTVTDGTIVPLDNLAENTDQIDALVDKLINAQISTTENKRTLYANQWNALTLPFDITPFAFCNAIGTYAVFDVLQAGGNALNFKITINEIPAYTPFLVKVDQEINLATKHFDNVIIKAIDDDALTQSTSVAANWSFIGTVEKADIANPTWTIQPNDEKGNIKLLYRDEAYNYKAFTAYITTQDGKVPANAPVIYVEEPDGSTTAITTINADGVAVAKDGWYTLNGVKLQGMPTEKGVYINNGKKVVLK